MIGSIVRITSANAGELHMDCLNQWLELLLIMTLSMDPKVTICMIELCKSVRFVKVGMLRINPIGNFTIAYRHCNNAIQSMQSTVRFTNDGVLIPRV